MCFPRLFAPVFLCAPLFFFALRVPPVLTGVVKSESGLPLAGASVRIQAGSERVRTSADGTFSLSTWPGRLTATKPGFRIGWLPSMAKPLAITLRPLPADDNDDYAWIAPGADPSKPNNCANCHREIYREWAGSAHARSADNPKLRALIDGPLPGWNLRSQHPLGVGVCAVCHAPTANDPLSDDAPHANKHGLARGVHCDYCHKIADAPTDKLGIRFGRDGYPLLRPKEGELLFFGPLDDAVRPGESFVHAPFTRESRYCASCHEAVIFGVHVYGTYSEWLDSPARATGQQCQSCHMRPTGSMTNVAPGHEGIERHPKTLASHSFPGGTAEMLRKCLQIHVEIKRHAEGTNVAVGLRADNVGHRVPTGFIDRHLVLVVEAFDFQGQHVAPSSGPLLDSAAGPDYAGTAGWLYAKRLHSKARSPLPFWLHAEGMTDTRLRPGVLDRRDFVFPPNAVKIRTRVLYRRFWSEVAAPLRWGDNERVLIDRSD